MEEFQHSWYVGSMSEDICGTISPALNLKDDTLLSGSWPMTCPGSDDVCVSPPPL